MMKTKPAPADRDRPDQFAKGDTGMDTDARALETALATLQQQYGNQFKGSMDSAQAQMRHTLEEKMGIDELSADRLVKKLIETGRLRYNVTNRDEDPNITTDTGPVIPVVGTTEAQGAGPVTVAATPAIGTVGAMTEMNSATNTTGGPGGNPVMLGAIAAATANEEDILGGDKADPYMPDPGSRAARENREGATMGQLGDTNVEAGGRTGTGSETFGEREARADDDTEGYWRIG
jgi:hypothetical protein